MKRGSLFLTLAACFSEQEKRFKDGKEHCYWSIVENRRVADGRVVQRQTLYRCLAKLLAHRRALFSHLQARWQALFDARFEVLLYDLTSTYFESDPPDSDSGKRRFGYSRDKRADCVQMVQREIEKGRSRVCAGRLSSKSTSRAPSCVASGVHTLHGLRVCLPSLRPERWR